MSTSEPGNPHARTANDIALCRENGDGKLKNSFLSANRASHILGKLGVANFQIQRVHDQ